MSEAGYPHRQQRRKIGGMLRSALDMLAVG